MINQERPLSFTQSGILLPSVDGNSNPFLDHDLGRGIQRTGQFTNILHLIEIFEKSISEGNDQYPNAHRMAEILNKIAITMYAEELSGEELTKEMANGAIEQSLPEAEAAIKEAEKILYPPTEPEKKNFIPEKQNLGNNELVRKQQQEKEEIRETRRQEEMARTLGSNFETVSIRVQQEDKPLVVYDPKLDEPSEEAAQYVRELFGRHF